MSDPSVDDKSAAAAAAKVPRKPAARSARRRSREFALQGLYQWLVSGEEAAVIDAHIREQDDFAKCDRAHFDALLHGCIAEAAGLDAVLARHVDRRTKLLSPLEHSILMSFGGTDGHKYVNGVLDKAAADLRPAEVAAPRTARGKPPSG